MRLHSAVVALAGGCIDILAVVVAAPVVVVAVALAALVVGLVADLDFLAASHCQPVLLV